MSIKWKISDDLVPYSKALNVMEKRVKQIIAKNTQEMVWLLEHPSIYTAGTSASNDELLQPPSLPVFKTGRGGKYTYHGPGQRVIYLMLNLKTRTVSGNPDLRLYVYNLEQLIIETLAELSIKGERRQGRIGIWVSNEDGYEAKIAAVGIRIKKWVTYHGIAINVNPNLAHFIGIVPCGIKDFGITSIEKLGKHTSIKQLDLILKEKFNKIFGELHA